MDYWKSLSSGKRGVIFSATVKALVGSRTQDVHDTQTNYQTDEKQHWGKKKGKRKKPVMRFVFVQDPQRNGSPGLSVP